MNQEFESPFVAFQLNGVDAEKFLQGQITCQIKKITDHYQATAICNLKGRVEFGLWLKKMDEQSFEIVLSQDCADSFVQHIKKFGAFSKIMLSNPMAIYPTIVANQPSFCQQANFDLPQWQSWQNLSIATGNYWITKNSQGLWQPQELRLHQRGGVDYDKGCYLGQEIVARLYFKASPKAWLHRIKAMGNVPNSGEKLANMDVVNAIAKEDGFEALVIAKPEQIGELGYEILPLPTELQADVARVKVAI